LNDMVVSLKWEKLVVALSAGEKGRQISVLP
jgi:hypothetical protein